ncbi:MAG TPA: hypothetical protein VMV46_03040 [Thermoanaerobaculia bacterium]|nr:hypothetical protein [Thermoanaerobaculia bacterium]
MHRLRNRTGDARTVVLLLLLAGAPCGCASFNSPRPPDAHALERLAREASPGAPSASWPADPLLLERALEAPLEVRAVDEIPIGKSRPVRLTVTSDLLERPVEVKWKRAPDDLDVINNSPRKEIAAYRVQKLVLDPPDFVVPTTVLQCLPIDALPGRRLEPQPLDGAGCAIGALSVWLDDVRHPAKKIEPARFWNDPVYAYHAANMNLVAILMDHSDSHRKNLLESTDPENRRMFSVDNGISFGSWFRNPFIRDWNRLRVPALRAESIERLRAVRREDLEALAVVAQLERGPDGVYRPVDPGESLDPGEGVRIRSAVIQLGLDVKEIDGVWARRARLLEAVDAGRVAVF